MYRTRVKLRRFFADRSFHPTAALRLVLGLAIMAAMGTILLSLPGMTTRPLSFSDRLFTSVSAVTVTGLNVAVPSTDFTRLGQIVLLILIQSGGVGFIALAVLALRLLGQRISLIHRVTLAGELGVTQSGRATQVLRRAIVVMLAIETLGAVLLWVHWRISGIVPPEDAVFYAIFHAVAAFCNAGFDLFIGIYPEGLPYDVVSLLVLGMLVILGGLGFPVYSDLIYRRRGTRLTLHSRVTIWAAVFLILLGTAGLIVAEFGRDRLLIDQSVTRIVTTAWFQSVSARTAGFPGLLLSFDSLGQASRFLLIGLMFIGSGPASMGGGITTGSFATLSLAAVSYTRGRRAATVAGRSIPQANIQRAVAVVLVSVGVVAAATWLLLLAHPQFALDAALFEVVSALSTCGLSLGITGELSNLGRAIIMLVMFWGRLGALTIMVALWQRRSTSGLIEYPEESILVG